MDAVFKTISLMDPAVDRARMTFDQQLEYVKKRDLALLQPFLISGAKPTIFYLREIPHALWKTHLLSGDEETRCVNAFQAAVVRVENLVTEEGLFIPTLELQRHPAPHDVLLEEEMKRFGPDEWLEIGGVAFQKGFFRRRTAKGFHAPRLWADMWARSGALPADANPTEQAPSSANPSLGTADTERPGTQAMPSSDASSASPTAAHAQAGASASG